MKTRAGFALLLAGIIGSYAGPVSTATAQDAIADAACQTAHDAAIDAMFKKILESRGVPEWAITAGDGSYAAWKEFLSTRDGERINATALSITKSALAALVPGAGAAITGSELSIAGVEATIGEAETQQARAFLCGGVSFGALRTPSFFAYDRVQQIAPGVTCGNFADRVTTYHQLTQLKEFWEGYYSQQVRQVAGDDPDTTNRLGHGWFTLQQLWAHRWAQTEMLRIRDELLRVATSPTAQPQQCARPVQVAGPVLQLDPARPPQPTPQDESWSTVSPGMIAYTSSVINGIYSWSALPATIGPEGTIVSLTVSGVATAGNGWGTGIQIRGSNVDIAVLSGPATGLDLPLNLERNGSGTQRMAVRIVPHNAPVGSEAVITVGAFYGAQVKYYYRVVSAAGS
jgi:hypothetical protein